MEAVAPYGEIKSDILHLKYQKDMNCLALKMETVVKMVLATKLIPYSIKIGG